MVHFAHQHHFSLELSLTVPITNSLAFLFTVLGDWYVDGKIISRDTWIGMALVCAGIGWVLVARSHLEILGAAGSPDLLTRSPGCVSYRKHELCRGICAYPINIYSVLQRCLNWIEVSFLIIHREILNTFLVAEVSVLRVQDIDRFLVVSKLFDMLASSRSCEK
jgi:Putative transmembrane family 234